MRANLRRKLITLTASLVLSCAAAFAEPMAGTTGSRAGEGWQVGWLTLKASANFKKGEVLKIKVDGNAENVIVRLLPATSDPSSPDGIEGQVRKVPTDHVLEVKLERDHSNVKQISVHGGNMAWDNPLGGNNGTVSIIGVERSAK